MKINPAKITFSFCLMITVGLLVGVTFGGSTAQADRDEPHDPIVGTWNCVVPPSGGFPQINVIKNIHAGGTVIELDNAAPPSQETATAGDWTRTGERRYLLTLEQFSFDAGGNFVGTYHYSNPLTLAKSHNSLSGSVDFTLVDPGGSVLVSGSATLTCTRLGTD